MKCDQCRIRGLDTEMNCKSPYRDEDDDDPSDLEECKCPVCGYTDRYDPYAPDEDDSGW